MYAMGRTVWKKWKRRYFVLVQVSQYTFAICSYKEKKADPSAMMQLDGYTVDYIEPAGGNYTYIFLYYIKTKRGPKSRKKCPKIGFWVFIPPLLVLTQLYSITLLFYYIPAMFFHMSKYRIFILYYRKKTMYKQIQK